MLLPESLSISPPGRVLVVDDIAANSLLLKKILKLNGFETQTASCGEEALLQIVRFNPDVVLMDIMMPGMDGHEVCRRIRAVPATRYLPVVMVTSLNGEAERVKALEAGADDFIAKP
ncbi:response regulator, partial [bacterium]